MVYNSAILAGLVLCLAIASVSATDASMEGLDASQNPANQPLALFATSGPADKFKYTRAHPKEGVQSAYDLDADMASLVFDRTKSSTQVKTLQDMYSTNIMMIDEENDELPEARIESHIVPKMKLIMYNDKYGAKQPDIPRFLDDDEIVITVKNHVPAHPNLDLDQQTMSNQKKLQHWVKEQTTHIGLAVNVKLPDGKRGAITLNNPRNYDKGLFNEPDLKGNANNYPMIFIRPRAPDSVSAVDAKAYNANFRTWTVIINTFSRFPIMNYNGGDPLRTTTLPKIMEYADWILDALAGTPEEKALAIRKIKADENMLYCAELVHVALNLGYHFPLNKASLGKRYNAVKKAIKNPRSWLITKDHKEAKEDEGYNPYIHLVKVNMAPSSLKPLHEVLGVKSSTSGVFDPALVMRPATQADLAHWFLKLYVDREKMGRNMQAKAATMLGTGLTRGAAAFQPAIRTLGEILRKEYASRAEFAADILKAVAPFVPYLMPDEKGSNVFVPPHLFWQRARFQEYSRAGRKANVWPDHHSLIRFDVVGYGAHEDYLKKKSSGRPRFRSMMAGVVQPRAE